MNNAKEKAQELVDKFENAIYEKFTYTGDGVEAIALAKEAALICCDEVLDDIKEIMTQQGRRYRFWLNVKTEIQNL